MRTGRLIALAWKSIWEHRLRSALTALGLICGVGAVIAMLAIGEGESQAALAQIREMGSSNILLASMRPAQNENASASNQRVVSYGLLERDWAAIDATLPDIDDVVPRRDIPGDARVGSKKVGTVLMGTTPTYAEVANLRLAYGRFLSPADAAHRRPVCVLGHELAQKLFLNLDPVGAELLVGNQAFRVVGALALRGEGTGGTAGVGGESDAALFIPLETMQDRYGRVIRDNRGGNRLRERVELHRLTVRATSADEAVIMRLAGALRHLIRTRHPRDDVRLTVPLELLRQARETKKRSRLILGTIAGISLLVGGIGIMNIMLASVVERTREIGIRRALGARKRHIVFQFLSETVLLCAIGGLLGLALGVLLPHLITRFFALKTVIEAWFLVLAFGTSAAIGLIFGLYPAFRAASLDPVQALRRE